MKTGSCRQCVLRRFQTIIGASFYPVSQLKQKKEKSSQNGQKVSPLSPLSFKTDSPREKLRAGRTTWLVEGQRPKFCSMGKNALKKEDFSFQKFFGPPFSSVCPRSRHTKVFFFFGEIKIICADFSGRNFFATERKD